LPFDFKPRAIVGAEIPAEGTDTDTGFAARRSMRTFVGLGFSTRFGFAFGFSLGFDFDFGFGGDGSQASGSGGVAAAGTIVCGAAVFGSDGHSSSAGTAASSAIRGAAINARRLSFDGLSCGSSNRPTGR
jgi:hypothetical protein